MTLHQRIPASIIIIIWFLFISYSSSYAQTNFNGLGQFIQINTRLRSYVGKPTWLLIIRDVDGNQNIPYLFDIRRGDNFWVALTYGKHYLITVSRLQIETYQSRCNHYKKYRINDFCHLESNGRIIRGESMSITLEGDLTPNSASSRCIVIKYAYPIGLYVVSPNGSASSS